MKIRYYELKIYGFYVGELVMKEQLDQSHQEQFVIEFYKIPGLTMEFVREVTI